MKTIYCTKTELKSLFYGNETLLENFEHIEISHFDDEIKKTKSQKKVLSFEDIKHPIFNPKEIIITFNNFNEENIKEIKKKLIQKIDQYIFQNVKININKINIKIIF